jgi:hypothetical protein
MGAELSPRATTTTPDFAHRSSELLSAIRRYLAACDTGGTSPDELHLAESRVRSKVVRLAIAAHRCGMSEAEFRAHLESAAGLAVDASAPHAAERATFKRARQLVMHAAIMTID